MTRVKFCGLTRPEDVDCAVSLGVDAIGLVFYEKSPRGVSVETAIALAARIPAFVTRVGLFVDADSGWIRDVAAAVRLNLVQLHGTETPEACEALGLPYIKAFRVRPTLDLGKWMPAYTSASGVLLDAYRPGVPGGTGAQFDWSLVPETTQPIILAGGLTPENVGPAVSQVTPWAVDVSGGIESLPGVKDPDKMECFLAACHTKRDETWLKP